MKTKALSLVLSCLFLASCQNANQIAMQLGPPAVGAVELRSMQTRRFETNDEPMLLAASTQALQDLGFLITESSAEVGVLAASKRRDATTTGQIVTAIFIAVLFGAHAAVIDKEQTIQVTLTSQPVANAKQIDMRVSFDRRVLDSQGRTRGELINDPKIYQEFFEKLSHAVFLEAKPL